MELFFKGFAIGFSIAAPVGPIGLLCIRRSLTDGTLIGLATGLGAATADAAYGCIAGFGLTSISGFLIRQKFWLELVGGGFLCYLGYRILTTRTASQPDEEGAVKLVPAYGSTLVLTLSNPLTMLSFAAVFAGFGLGTATGSGYSPACKLVAGVFSGSALWWLFLSGGVGLMRLKIPPGALRWINWLSGCIIIAFGLYALSQSFLH